MALDLPIRLSTLFIASDPLVDEMFKSQPNQSRNRLLEHEMQLFEGEE